MTGLSVPAGVVAAVVLAGALAAGDSQTTQAPVFRSGASGVSVDVSVRDRSGRAVTGLRAGDFLIFDNGVEQAVESVSYDKLPIDITVALDVSYSVSGVLLDRLRRGVSALMKDLGPADRLKLLLFNMRVSRVVDFTRDASEVERAIDDAAAGGGTALFDAISVSLVSSSAPDRRHLVVFFTDGRDSSSVTTPPPLREVAERTRASLAFVMPMTSTGPSASLWDPTRNTTTTVSTALPPGGTILQGLADQTGGLVMPFSPGGDLSAAFRRVLEQFRAAYVLYYDVQGVARTGYHAIEVRVNRSGVAVHARRGYWY